MHKAEAAVRFREQEHMMRALAKQSTAIGQGLLEAETWQHATVKMLRSKAATASTRNWHGGLDLAIDKWSERPDVCAVWKDGHAAVVLVRAESLNRRSWRP